MSNTPRVVIVGGGFGGLNAARELSGARVEMTLVDRRNHHLFQPLLYQVATAALNPSDIAIPIRRILRNQKNVEVLLAEARAVDLAAKVVFLDEGSVPYDHLIVATGARHSYFGHESWTRVRSRAQDHRRRARDSAAASSRPSSWPSGRRIRRCARRG